MRYLLVLWTVLVATLTGSPAAPVDQTQTFGEVGCALHLQGVKTCQGL